MTIGLKEGGHRGSIWEKLKNKSTYVKTGGSIKMILEYVTEMINASTVSKFRDNRPKERVGKGGYGR